MEFISKLQQQEMRQSNSCKRFFLNNLNLIYFNLIYSQIQHQLKQQLLELLEQLLELLKQLLGSRAAGAAAAAGASSGAAIRVKESAILAGAAYI